MHADAERRAPVQEMAHECFVHDHHARVRGVVVEAEVASIEERNAECVEVAGPDRGAVGLHVLIRLRRVALDLQIFP